MLEFLGSLIPSVVGLFGSLMSNQTNSQNAARSNQLNLQMFHEGNAFNRQERIETQDWNWQRTLDMFNLNNEYNNPLNQAARLRAAGINPAAVMGNDSNYAAVSSAPSSSPASSGSFAGAVTPDFQDPTNSMVNAAIAFSQIMKQNAETEGLRINNESQSFKNDIEIQKTRAEIDKIIADNDVSKETKQNLMWQSHVLESQWKQNQFNLRNQDKRWTMEQQQFDKVMRQFDNQHAAHELNMVLGNLDKQFKQFDLDNLGVRFKYELMFKRQQLANMVESNKLTIAQTKHEAKKLVETVCRANLLRTQNNEAQYHINELELNQARTQNVQGMRDFLPFKMIDDLTFWMTSTVGNVFSGLSLIK